MFHNITQPGYCIQNWHHQIKKKVCIQEEDQKLPMTRDRQGYPTDHINWG